MGTSKMDSSAVYTLFEELKQRIDELSKKSIQDNQANSTSDSEDTNTHLSKIYKIRINQQQFTPEQIKKSGTDFGLFG